MRYGRGKSRQSDISASAGAFFFTGVVFPWRERSGQQRAWETMLLGTLPASGEWKMSFFLMCVENKCACVCAGICFPRFEDIPGNLGLQVTRSVRVPHTFLINFNLMNERCLAIEEDMMPNVT